MLTIKDFNKVLVQYLYDKPILKTTVASEPLAGFTKVIVDTKQVSDVEIQELYVSITGHKGSKRGVVVALDNGVFGWSLCNTRSHKKTIIDENGNTVTITTKGDVFDKRIALDKALKRAEIAKYLNPEQRVSFYAKLPETLLDIFGEIEQRAKYYFNSNQKND